MNATGRPFWRRSLAVLTVMAVCYAAVGGKLAVLQLAEHQTWQTLAEEQQFSDSIVSDKRGEIVDRNGVVLAQSTAVFTVVMEPDEIPNEETRLRICKELSELLDVSYDTLYKKTGKTYSRYETVKAKIDKELCYAVAEWVKDRGYTAIFRILADYKREYPLGNTLSCVLGFTGAENTGLEGLEAKYNSLLAGKAGRIVTTKNGWGDVLPNDLQYETAIESQQGAQLTLTVDVNVQKTVEKHLDRAVAETAAAGRTCAIVMDVKTGRILAMSTRPDYDLNNPRVLTDTDVKAQIAQLSGDEQSAALLTALQKQWKNKAVSEFYEPGSVFKIFTVSMALSEKLVSENSHFFCNGTFQMSGVRAMKCHVYPRSHGDQTLAEAISHSCNPAFMKIGSLVGTTLFPLYHERFGFTSVTGIDMLGEARVTPSLYHAASAITAVDVATSSIGQTFKVTPIQMITGVCAVANGGVLMQPYVVSTATAADGTVLLKQTPTEKRRVITADTSSRVCAMLEGVVDGGGAKNAYVAGYRVAGKTGTSEKTDQKTVSANGRKGVVASFCGFAPADDPQVAVMIMVDEPQTAIRYGGTLAAPVAARILEEVLPYLGIEAAYKEEEIEAMRRTVPSVTDKTVSQATALLESKDLRYRIVGNGTQVTGQSPAADQPILRGGTVVLYTDGETLQTVTVPSVVGMTLQDANRALTEAGLNVSIEAFTPPDGKTVTERQVKVISQRVPSGEQLPHGTVIKLVVG